MRAKRPVTARTIRRKQCPFCRQRLPFEVDAGGNLVMQAHDGLGQENKPESERSQCLGVGMRASQE